MRPLAVATMVSALVVGCGGAASVDLPSGPASPPAEQPPSRGEVEPSSADETPPTAFGTVTFHQVAPFERFANGFASAAFYDDPLAGFAYAASGTGCSIGPRSVELQRVSPGELRLEMSSTPHAVVLPFLPGAGGWLSTAQLYDATKDAVPDVFALDTVAKPLRVVADGDVVPAFEATLTGADPVEFETMKDDIHRVGRGDPLRITWKGGANDSAEVLLMNAAEVAVCRFDARARSLEVPAAVVAQIAAGPFEPGKPELPRLVVDVGREARVRAGRFEVVVRSDFQDSGVVQMLP